MKRPEDDEPLPPENGEEADTPKHEAPKDEEPEGVPPPTQKPDASGPWGRDS